MFKNQHSQQQFPLICRGPTKIHSNKHTHIFQDFIDKKTAEVSGNIKGAHAASELRRKKSLEQHTGKKNTDSSGFIFVQHLRGF